MVRIDMDVWYRIRLMVQSWTLGIDMESWFRLGLVVLAKTNGMDIDLLY